MRKVALLLAVLLAASLSTSADAKRRKAAAKPDPAVAAGQNTYKFVRDASNPYWATAQSAQAKKIAKHSKKKKGKKKKG